MSTSKAMRPIVAAVSVAVSLSLTRPIACRAADDALANACSLTNPAKGVVEIGGNNKGEAVVSYLKMAGASAGDPWCAAFAHARYRLALARLDGEGKKGLALPVGFPRSAAVASYKAWAKHTGRWRSVADVRAGKYTPQKGDMVVFDWDNEPGNDHVGIVLFYADGTISSVEGNTRPSGVSRDSLKGDGVWNRHRTLANLGTGGGFVVCDF